MTDFDRAFELVVWVEGGSEYQSQEQAVARNDPGGETRFGISRRQYPGENIRDLTLTRAKEIYKKDYWDKAKGDLIKWPMNLFLFDCAVNQGIDAKANFAAIKLLQKTLRLPQDGILGHQTLKAAMEMNEEQAAMFMADRALRYTGTRNFDTNGRGWFARLFKITMKGGTERG